SGVWARRSVNRQFRPCGEPNAIDAAGDPRCAERTGVHASDGAATARTTAIPCSPDGIRTRATALRGRRARPLHNGARTTRKPYSDVSVRGTSLTHERGRPANRPRHNTDVAHADSRYRDLAGVPGFEPRTTEPESAVLPITPYPTVGAARSRTYSTRPAVRAQIGQHVVGVD